MNLIEAISYFCLISIFLFYTSLLVWIQASKRLQKKNPKKFNENKGYLELTTFFSPKFKGDFYGNYFMPVFTSTLFIITNMVILGASWLIFGINYLVNL